MLVYPTIAAPRKKTILPKLKRVITDPRNRLTSRRSRFDENRRESMQTNVTLIRYNNDYNYATNDHRLLKYCFIVRDSVLPPVLLEIYRYFLNYNESVRSFASLLTM